MSVLAATILPMKLPLLYSTLYTVYVCKSVLAVLAQTVLAMKLPRWSNGGLSIFGVVLSVLA